MANGASTDHLDVLESLWKVVEGSVSQEGSEAARQQGGEVGVLACDCCLRYQSAYQPAGADIPIDPRGRVFREAEMWSFPFLPCA
jgi:hypothetical protein